MGLVYEAEDLRLGRRAALKFLPQELASDPTALQRLEREAQTASALNHPNICTIYDIDDYAGQRFIAMELLEGETLQHRLAASAPDPIPPLTLIDIAIQVCVGLEAAHGKDIVHRDIKPANIFLTTQGSVKILDFGVAKLVATEEVPGVGRSRGGRSRDRPPRRPYRAATESDADRRHRWHDRLHVTGAGAQGTARRPLRPVLPRLRALRDGDRPARVHGRNGGGRAGGDSHQDTSGRRTSSTPRSLARLPRSSPRRSRRIARCATRLPPTCGTTSRERARSCCNRTRVAPGGGFSRPRSVLVIAAAAVWIPSRRTSRVTLAPNDTIVLAHLTNATGDRVFDDALYTALRIGLEQTPYLNVLADDKLRGNVAALGLDESARITPEVALQLCRRTGSRIVAAPAIAESGNRLALELKGIDCQSGSAVTRIEQEAASRDGVVAALGAAALQLRTELGEPASSIAQYDAPLERATSSSPDALELLRLGYRRQLAGDTPGAIPLLPARRAGRPELRPRPCRAQHRLQHHGRDGVVGGVRPDGLRAARPDDRARSLSRREHLSPAGHRRQGAGVRRALPVGAGLSARPDRPQQLRPVPDGPGRAGSRAGSVSRGGSAHAGPLHLRLLDRWVRGCRSPGRSGEGHERGSRTGLRFARAPRPAGPARIPPEGRSRDAAAVGVG